MRKPKVIISVIILVLVVAGGSTALAVRHNRQLQAAEKTKSQQQIAKLNDWSTKLKDWQDMPKAVASSQPAQTPANDDSTAPAMTDPSTLPNTGPGNVIVRSAVVAFLAAIAHQMQLRHKAKRGAYRYA